jgi:UDP-hydrolysing UDP-N-acetyl-D-glucosamine 2-epimerase
MADRRICFITGARSEYDILFPVIRACQETPGLSPFVIAGAGHLSRLHGHTIDLIEADGVTIAATIESLLASDSWNGRALSFGSFFEGLCRALPQHKADLLVVAGDREEALAGALAGNFLRTPVAHLFGGDRCIASDVDEVFRPAISKLAHLHFAATEAHRDRLIKMGESADHVWNVGATSLDRLADEPLLNLAALESHLGTPLTSPYFLVIHHPSPAFNADATAAEMEAVLDGVLAAGYPVFCSYPNFDPGNIAMREVIERARVRHQNLHIFSTLPRAIFVNLFRHCAAIVGNSSAILIEAPFLKVPGILVGPRQDLRDRGGNIIPVGFDAVAIAAACRHAADNADFRARVKADPSPYGDGASARRIAELLAHVPVGPELLIKTMTY